METVYLHVHAKDDAVEQWSAEVTDRNNPKDWFSVKGDYVLSEQLIEAIYHMARRMWRGKRLKVDTCIVDDNDDSGMLKPMLQERLDVYNDVNKGGPGRLVQTLQMTPKSSAGIAQASNTKQKSYASKDSDYE